MQVSLARLDPVDREDFLVGPVGSDLLVVLDLQVHLVLLEDQEFQEAQGHKVRPGCQVLQASPEPEASPEAQASKATLVCAVAIN